jgi:hypothetical protein
MLPGKTLDAKPGALLHQPSPLPEELVQNQVNCPQNKEEQGNKQLQRAERRYSKPKKKEQANRKQSDAKAKIVLAQVENVLRLLLSAPGHTPQQKLIVFKLFRKLKGERLISPEHHKHFHESADKAADGNP